LPAGILGEGQRNVIEPVEMTGFPGVCFIHQGGIVKTQLIVITLIAIASPGLAGAQSTAPTTSPAVAADKAKVQADRKKMEADRAQLKQDHEQTKADREAGNKSAVAADRAKMKTDREAAKADHQTLEQDRKALRADRQAAQQQQTPNTSGK
jgi:outer membrane murein-binding lipoprotein Lpp